MTPSRTIRLIALFIVLAATAGCDQATKHLARSELSPLGPTTLAGRFIEFTLAENPGAFLSLGASLPQAARSAILTIGVSVGLAFLMAYLIRKSALRRLPFLGLALAWAGGMSNLFDRFARGGLVTDFMVVRVGPFHTGIFNLADLVIVIGMLTLVLSLLAGQRRGEAPQAGGEHKGP